MKKLILLLVLVLIVAGGVYLYLPRGGASADSAATLSVFNTAIDAQKGSADFAPALDGEILANGDLVKSNKDGRGVLTFFDASTLTVDPGSLVKVLSLNRLGNGGIQATIEQTLGRSWSSVSKLKTPDSKWEIKTPTSTAAVRGTSFETIVVQNPDGTVTVTYKTDDGELLVTANAGGTTTVGAGQQVSISTNQPAQPAQPQPPTPRFVLNATAGLGYAITAETGATCGSEGNRQEIFGCVAQGNRVTLREPPAGRYRVMITAASAVPSGVITLDAFRGTTQEANSGLSLIAAAGDLFRSGFTYAAGTPIRVSPFDPAEKVTSVCGAQAPGRVFSGGALQQRADQLAAFAAANKNQVVALVITDADLTDAARSGIPPDLPVTVNDVKAKIDGAGVHVSGQLSASFLTVTGAADVILGVVDGKLAVRLRSLSANPLPAALLDQVKTEVQRGLDESRDSFPYGMRQVLLRPGCLALVGVTPA